MTNITTAAVELSKNIFEPQRSLHRLGGVMGERFELVVRTIVPEEYWAADLKYC